MSDILSELSNNLAAAVDHAASAVVQIAGHRRSGAGVIFADNLIVTATRGVGDDTVVVRRPTGEITDGHVLGYSLAMGISVVRAPDLGMHPATPAPEPRVGSLAVAIGRTWSGGIIASVTNVAVVGGPLRMGRASEMSRVIRVAQSPHSAFTGGALVDAHGAVLGIITGSAIRGTTVVVPATLAWDAAHHIVKRGGIRQGFLGISTMPVLLPVHQRPADSPPNGLLITAVSTGSPAETAGLLVGDVVTHFAGEPLSEPESLVTFLRGDRIGKAVAIAVVRGRDRQEVAVTVGERPLRRA